MDELNVSTENNPKQKKSGGKTVRMKETLKEELSKCFFKGTQKQPLCIGIHIQVHTHYKDDSRFEPLLIQQGLNSYCSSPKYLKTIVANAPRINIHGIPTGIVTAEEEAYAKKRIQKIEDDAKKREEIKLQKKLKREEAENLLNDKKINKPKQKPIIKPEPIAIPLEELRKRITLREVENPKTAPTKEELKQQNKEKYAKKMARKTTSRK